VAKKSKPRVSRLLRSVGPPLTLEYDLSGLPTAQHKAGLAGLVLLIKAMRELNRVLFPDVTIDALTARITFCRAKYQALMDELYGAGWAVSREYKVRKKKLPDGSKDEIPPLRSPYAETIIDKKTGKARQVLVHEYKDVVPGGPFFAARCFGNLADRPRWLELWSDAIWNTVRGIPATRNPYNERADGLHATGSGVADLWDQLIKEMDCREKNLLHTMPVASSIRLGAQDHNAEYVAFQGSPKETLLLHFWNVVMQVFIPQVMGRDSKTGNVKVTSGDGYILAIPEVSDLITFQEDFAQALATLADDPIRVRPPDSFVCLPQEGALQLLSQLSARARTRATGRIRYSVSAIEVFHLHKPGNVVVTLASDRLVVDDETLTDFERIHRRTHPLLRAHLIRALLRGEPWYRGLNRLAAETDAEWLVGHSGGDWSTAQFCGGVREQFEIDAYNPSKGAGQ
jgi:CRISPR-associated protein Cmx8